jgi:two-component system chemotaxis response regulator CheB
LHRGRPIVIVQHMPPVFTELLAKRLDDVGTVPVVQASDGAELQPGRAYLAPGDHHLLIEGHESSPRLRLNQDPPENSCRPSVDPLFRSAVNVYGANVLGLILTGMGSDGLSGARSIRDAGGVIVAQDEATSVVWGMPGAVVRAGLADVVVPLDAIAHELVVRCSKASPSDLRTMANR